MAWTCEKCHYFEFEDENGQQICLNCAHSSYNDDRSEARFSPTKDPSDMSDSEDDLEKQVSYDKTKCQLKGAALSSKKLKMVSELPEDEDRVDTEDLKSLPSNVYITEVKRRSRRASDLKKKVNKDLLRLSVECGYAVQLICTGPKPASGPRGVPLKLNLCDVNGLKAKCSCKKVKPFDCECQFKKRFNVGIQTPNNIPSLANIPPGCKKLTPSKSRNLESRAKIGKSLVSPIFGSNLSSVTSDDFDDNMDQTNQHQYNAEAEEENSEDQMETETQHENDERQKLPSSLGETVEGKQKPTQMNPQSKPPQKNNLQQHAKSTPTQMKSPQQSPKPERTQINPELSSKLKPMQTMNPQQTKPSNPSLIWTKQAQTSSSSQMKTPSFPRPFESNGLALPLKPLPAVKRSGPNSKQNAMTRGSFFPPTRVDPNVKLGIGS